jgi:uncharacterized membrane protein (DUF485 family)
MFLASMPHATMGEDLGESEGKECSHLVRFLSFLPYFLGIKVAGKHSRLKFGKILPLKKMLVTTLLKQIWCNQQGGWGSLSTTIHFTVSHVLTSVFFWGQNNWEFSFPNVNSMDSTILGKY